MTKLTAGVERPANRQCRVLRVMLALNKSGGIRDATAQARADLGDRRQASDRDAMTPLPPSTGQDLELTDCRWEADERRSNADTSGPGGGA